MKKTFGVLATLIFSTKVFAGGAFTKENLDFNNTKWFVVGLDMALEQAAKGGDYEAALKTLESQGANSGGAIDFIRSARDSADPKAEFKTKFGQANDYMMSDLRGRNINVNFTSEMDELNKFRVLYKVRKKYQAKGSQKWPLLNIFIGSSTSKSQVARPIDVFVSSALEKQMDTTFKPTKSGVASMSERLGWTADRTIFETYHPIEASKPIPQGLTIAEFDSNAKVVKMKNFDPSTMPQNGQSFYQIDISKMNVYEEIKFPEWMTENKVYNWNMAVGEKKIAVSGYPVKRAEIKDATMARVSRTGDMEVLGSYKAEDSDLGVYVDPDHLMEALSTLKISAADPAKIFEFGLPNLQPSYCKT